MMSTTIRERRLAMNVRAPCITSSSGPRSRTVIETDFVATRVRSATAAAAGAVVLTLMTTTMFGCGDDAKGPPRGDALPSWPSDPNWQSSVLGPHSDDVTPVAIKRAHGNVTNPEALVRRNGTTTMTVAPGGPPAVIVLDYGQEVGGTPHLEVADASGSPQVRISTSEALPFLNSNTTTTPVQAAAAGATNIKVASIAPFYAGTPMTVGVGDGAETVTVTDVGSAAAPDTSLVLPATAGASKINVASLTGYVTGEPLIVGSGASAQQVIITGVGTAAGVPTTLVYPAAAGASNVKIASTAGFAAGDSVLIGAGDATAVRIVTDVGTAATTTGLVAGASAGDRNIKVASVAALTVGAQIDINPGPAQEHVTITNVGTAGVNTSVSVANTTSGTPPPTLTGASWIWNVPGATSTTPAGTIYVRRTFVVADPASLPFAVLRVNADDGYTAYVNGTQVASTTGANNAWQTSQIVDIKSLLVAGTNVIAIAPFNGAGAGSVIAAADIGSSHLITDASWKALPGNPAIPPAGWNTVGFDDSAWGAAYVTGAYGIAPWNDNIAQPPGPTTLRVSSITGLEPGDTITIGAGADQENRTVALVSGAGANQIVTVTEPLAIAHPPGAAVLDTSKPGTGIDFTPALSGDHAVLSTLALPGTGVTFTPPLTASLERGTAIRGAGTGITFSPALTSNAAVGSTVSSPGTGVSFTPALTKTHAAGETIRSIGTYVNDNGTQINLTVVGPDAYTGGLRGGFRFEAIELRSAGTVTLSGAGLNFKAYRATADQYKGWFASSDDQLNRMWYAGAYTAQMDMVPVGVNACFQKPVIFDGAKRDRAIWSGDLMVSDPVALLSLGSNAAPYVTGSIDAFIGLQAVSGRLTSAVGFRGCGAFDYAVTYSAASAMIAVQYYRYTGDTAYITALLPNLEAALAYSASRLDQNGLLVTTDNDYW
jgi:hypothetical protein